MKKIKVVLTSFLFACLLGVTIGCAELSAGKKEPIVFADGGFDSNKFHNEVASIIIEEGYGYDTEQVTGSGTALMTGIEKQEIDVDMEFWSENVRDAYDKGLEEGYYVRLSVNFSDNFQGLYVPTYVIEGDEERGIEPMAPDLKYITDLPEYWELFMDPEDHEKGLIVGSITGWTLDELLRTAIKEYGIDETYNYISPGSESAINISLANAYENGEAWLGYNYEPNWVMAKYDMTPIIEEVDDGLLASMGPQDVDIVSHPGLIDRAPDVVSFLKNYQTSSEISNNALVYIQEERATAYDAAVKFLKEEEELWTNWVPKDIAEKVKKAIQ